jgi:hypothetical protein
MLLIIKKRQKQLDDNEEVGLEVKAEKTKCTFVSRHRTTEQNRDIKAANKSLKNVGGGQRSNNWK